MQNRARKRTGARVLSTKVGYRILQLRVERGWTQRQLSENTRSLDQGFVSRIETGRIEPCLGTLSALAKGFGLSLSELLKGV
jgi:transcriptional regulator with XRE-family HTH domain